MTYINNNKVTEITANGVHAAILFNFTKILYINVPLYNIISNTQIAKEDLSPYLKLLLDQKLLLKNDNNYRLNFSFISEIKLI